MLDYAEQKPFFQKHGCRLITKYIADPASCAEMKSFPVQRIFQTGGADILGDSS
jgi:hypothetical protein